MSPSLDLNAWCHGAATIVIVGVGNPWRHDDGVGIAVVRALRGHVSESVVLLDSETVPENYLDRIVAAAPTHILIIDAAILGQPPGTVKFVQKLPEADISISTHALPLQLFVQYLARTTRAKIGLLLVQPGSVAFGEGLTPPLQTAMQSLRDLLLALSSIRK